jgi:hypothetical protein
VALPIERAGIMAERERGQAPWEDGISNFY